MNYVLYAHAAQCLGVKVGHLNLPRCGDGVELVRRALRPCAQGTVRRK
jgi:hypothetical protein